MKIFLPKTFPWTETLKMLSENSNLRSGHNMFLPTYEHIVASAEVAINFILDCSTNCVELADCEGGPRIILHIEDSQIISQSSRGGVIGGPSSQD